MIPSPCIRMEGNVGGPGGPRPHIDDFPTREANEGITAAVNWSGPVGCPADVAVIAHTVGVRAAIMYMRTAVTRDSGFSARGRRAG
jgi:hypothetical protein